MMISADIHAWDSMSTPGFKLIFQILDGTTGERLTLGCAA